MTVNVSFEREMIIEHYVNLSTLYLNYNLCYLSTKVGGVMSSIASRMVSKRKRTTAEVCENLIKIEILNVS